MSTVLVFTLEKKAKSGGGDKYVCNTQDSQQEFNIYIPQTISRKDNVPHQSLQVTIQVKQS
uniref:Uncharacterized protein n=1 Tax=viral metagenome TaxID=1070528 RepID=A0A6C0KGW7_9ZZZZ